MARCEICKTKFKQVRFLQKTCSAECEKEFRNDNPFKKISNKSEKRKIQEKIYKDVRKIYLSNNPKCECDKSHTATEIHHINGRNGDRLNDINYFLSVCRLCHSWIHENPKEARKKEWLK
jgi:hypothetical protein